MLSWACTCHKVQSVSILEATVSFQLYDQKQFNRGQIYVALSRVKVFEGLYLIGEYLKSAIRVNQDAAKEYERLRQENLFVYPKDFPVTESNIVITLLNTRSLRKHAVDTANDEILCQNDILCLTETQLSENSDTSEIENVLNNFSIEYNTSIQSKFKSLAMCHKNSITLLEHDKHEGISLLKLRKHGVCDFTIAMIYRQPSVVLNTTFYDHIAQLVSQENIDILLGDLNINALDSRNDVLGYVLSQYVLLVDEPTHISGGLIDHVYVKKSFLENKTVLSSVRSVFFSDHDAVKFSINLM